MDFTRQWTAFAVETEVSVRDGRRLAKAHNEIVAHLEAVIAKRDEIIVYQVEQLKIARARLELLGGDA